MNGFKTSCAFKELQLLTGSLFDKWRRNFPGWNYTLEVLFSLDNAAQVNKISFEQLGYNQTCQRISG